MFTKINSVIGAWLLVKGNKKEQLAAVIGISVATLNNRLDGSCPWLFDEVCRVADFFGCSIEDLRD